MSGARTQGGASRPLIWWRESELGALRAHIEERLAQFGRAWGLTVTISALHNACDAVLPPAAQVAGAWTSLEPACQAAHGMWVAGAAELSTLIERAMFGESRGAAVRGVYDNVPSIAGTVAAQALQGLAAALAGSDSHGTSGDARSADATPSTDGPPARQQLPWSGAVRAQLSIEGQATATLGWHLDPTRAQAWMSPRAGASASGPVRAALTPVLEAMHRQPVALTVRLADIELDLGALLALEPGDVITVDHALDHPVPLYLHEAGGAGPLAAGHLGALNEVKAIQLLAHAGAHTGISRS